MQFAFEVPLKYLDEFAPYQDYCYCFSHLLKNDKDGSYRKWVRNQKELGRTILCDNGANEGSRSTKKDLFEIAKDIDADIVVAPDSISNHKETIELVKDFYSSLPKSYSRKVLIPFQGIGEDVQDLFRVMRDGDILGFPIGRVASVNQDMILTGNYLLDAERMRFEIMKETYKTIRGQIRDRDIKGHLLGLKNPYMLKTYGYYDDFLVSLDTTFVSILAKEGIELDDHKDYCFPWESIAFDFDFDWGFGLMERGRVIRNICVIKEMYENGRQRYDNEQLQDNLDERWKNNGRLNK